ncbi:Vng6185h (plasmid) [Halobacterium salinarum NRC-1]|uniref:Vng6185h n=3 Tax=Halobacterium salinarum TaxID=2242 RepID=Q9HHX4_HALSA|nr:Vng6185h [Halobacterium salinarum NRC-1]MBB6090637.1 hypothetical protein [Halobacterium salinarum]CAP15456.1 uncharacterized protein OE_5067R [Halobacterium salinarum R1]DAC79822.1 TPA_inf: uncharacterized protein VNG_6185H [Halobacterium salinarum NRC-1]
MFSPIVLSLSTTTTMMYSPVAGWEADSTSVPHESNTLVNLTIRQEDRQSASNSSETPLM